MNRARERLDGYFRSDWPLVPFQPILYFFLFGVAVRLWINQTEPINFDSISPGIYGIWIGLGVVCPMLSLLSFYCIEKCSGIWRYRGMWFRLAADSGIFFYLLAFHISSVTNLKANEIRIFSRYCIGAILIFVLLLVVRDIWALRENEKTARIIQRGR